MENNQEARTGGKRQNFWKKNIYTLILSIKEQLWRVFKLNFEILSFLRLSSKILVYFSIGSSMAQEILERALPTNSFMTLCWFFLEHLFEVFPYS